MFLTGQNIIILDEVESTNNYAMQLVSDGAVNGTVVLAHFQTGGKGQAGNYWESGAGKNLLASVILYPSFLMAARQFFISKIVSLSLLNLLKPEAADVLIKWPNDIYIGTRKVAGILIENAIKGARLDYSIIGVGLNLNQEKFGHNAPNPVSLKQLNGKNYDVQETLKMFLGYFRKWYYLLETGQFQKIDQEYLGHLLGFNQWRRFRKDNRVFEARISGIGGFGQLRLEDRQGNISEYMFKEVEFVM